MSTVATSAPLTAADRCDQCGAQAYIRVEFASGELLFCAHHGRRHSDALAASAEAVHDHSEKLTDQDD